MALWSVPRLLVVHLKRFSEEEGYGGRYSFYSFGCVGYSSHESVQRAHYHSSFQQT